jgi:hypothetical protein
MSKMANVILETAKALPEGGVVAAKEFLHLGSRAAIDQTLSRMTKTGQLLKVGRGTYTLPVSSRFGQRPPSTEALLAAMAEQQGEMVVPQGAASANALGLSTQVPVQEIYFTTGRSRKLKVGAKQIELKHAPNWQMRLGQRPAGMAIRALAWLGAEQAPFALQQLRRKLPRAEWEALRNSRATLPSWMAKLISEETHNA